MGLARHDDRTHLITRLLREASSGRSAAFDQLLPLVYDELKQVARARLRSQRDGHTLTPTALVHETYLKLVDHTQVEWQSRAHFFAVASGAMRQILIDYAKRRRAAKRGGGAVHLSIDETIDLDFRDQGISDAQAEGLVALDAALTRLAEFDDRGAKVVQYRFFGGLAQREIAEVLGTSEVTVRRAWAAAKAWLRREVETAGRPGLDSLGATGGAA
jgi:RNA polymerase sigma factor (TIGR02999 family)